jgi:hypothetical protein
MWVDAICINQDDPNERVDQVLRMKDIYRFAQHVLVWLGPADWTSDLALDSLRRVGERLEATRAWELPPPEWARGYEWRHPTCEVPVADSTWHAIYDLVSSLWFYRIDAGFSSCAEVETNLLDRITGKPGISFLRASAVATGNPLAPVKMFFLHFQQLSRHGTRLDFARATSSQSS